MYANNLGITLIPRLVFVFIFCIGGITLEQHQAQPITFAVFGVLWAYLSEVMLAIAYEIQREYRLIQESEDRKNGIEEVML